MPVPAGPMTNWMNLGILFVTSLHFTLLHFTLLHSTFLDNKKEVGPGGTVEGAHVRKGTAAISDAFKYQYNHRHLLFSF